MKIACVQLATRFRDTSLYPAKVRSIFEYVPLQPSKNKKKLDKSAVSASSPPVCPHSPMPGWRMKKGLFRSEVVVFISEIVFVFSEVVSFISEVDKTCVEVQGVVAHCSCIFPRARAHYTHPCFLPSLPSPIYGLCRKSAFPGEGRLTFAFTHNHLLYRHLSTAMKE